MWGLSETSTNTVRLKFPKFVICAFNNNVDPCIDKRIDKRKKK